MRLSVLFSILFSFILIPLTGTCQEVTSNNVGIGTSSPRQKLDVLGRINILDDDQSPTKGAIRFNELTNQFEGFNGFKWVTFSGGGKDSWEIPGSLDDYISPGNSDAYFVRSAINNDGSAIVIWGQMHEGVLKVYKSEYRNGEWEHPNSLSDFINPGLAHAYDLRVEMDDLGNIIISWTETVSGSTYIFLSEYRNGAWTHPSDLSDKINPLSGIACCTTIAMDDSGNALISWEQADGTGSKIYMSEYRNGSWTHPSDDTDYISPNAGGDAHHPSAAMDNNGNAIIAWDQMKAVTSHIYMSEYRNGSWTHPGIDDYISPDPAVAGNHANFPDVAMDNNGNAVVAWVQELSPRDLIYKSEYRSGSWIHPASVYTDYISVYDSNANVPDVSMDDGDVAMITWIQHDGSYYQVYLSEYRFGVWRHPASLSDHISPSGQDALNFPKVATSSFGSAYVIWDQSDGTKNQIFLSSFLNGSWRHPRFLSENITPDYTDAFSPAFAVNDFGQAILAWSQFDGMYNRVYIGLY